MADLGSVRYIQLFSSTNVVATSAPYLMPRGPSTYQATVSSVTTATAVITGQVVVQVSNDEVAWLPLGTCNPTGTGSGAFTDGFASIVPWKDVRMVITTLTTGTASGAVLTARLGV